MSSPTVQRQLIRRAWEIDLIHSEWEHLHKAKTIYVEIYTNKRKEIYLGHYFPTQTPIDIKRLVGMTVAQASIMLRTRKEKYQTLSNLIGGNEE